MDVIKSEVSIGLIQNKWIKVSEIGETSSIRNISGHTAFLMEWAGDPPPDAETINPDNTPGIMRLGGYVGAYISVNETETYAMPVGDQPFNILKRPYGQNADIPKEVVDIYNSLMDLKKIVDLHVADIVSNPHQIDGLDEFLKMFDIVYDPEDSDKSGLATTYLTHQIWSKLNEHVDAIGNVHNYDVEQFKLDFGLDKVPNIAVATEEEAADQENNASIITPKSFHQQFTERADDITINAVLPVQPQLVLEGALGGYDVMNSTLPEADKFLDWGKYGVSRVPQHLIKSEGGLLVQSGLVVSYAYDTEVCVTRPLVNDIEIPVDVASLEEGEYYVYVHVDDNNHIVDASIHEHTMLFAPYQPVTPYPGYMFNTNTMCVYDSTGAMVRRTLVGSFSIVPALDPSGENVVNKLVGVTPAPVGYKHTFVCGIEPGEKKPLASRFNQGDAECECKVIIDGQPSPTGWDDGVGVAAIEFHDYKEDSDKILLIGGGSGIMKSSNPTNIDLDVSKGILYRKVSVMITTKRRL